MSVPIVNVQTVLTAQTLTSRPGFSISTWSCTGAHAGWSEPECPVDAIKPDTEPDLEKWLELNREFAQKWPNITAKKDMLKDARAYWDETGKFDKYFSAKPGEGD